MSYIEIPSRSINDLNSAADINQLMLNIKELKESLDNVVSNVFLNANPVNSIYISVSSVNPSTIYGGTWVAFGTGKTIVGVSAGEAEFNTVEKTGGEKTHVLAWAELAYHNHTILHTHEYQAGSPGVYYTTAYGVGAQGDLCTGTLGAQRTSYQDADSGFAGSNIGHNNLQPYITVYMWKRTN